MSKLIAISNKSKSNTIEGMLYTRVGTKNLYRYVCKSQKCFVLNFENIQ